MWLADVCGCLWESFIHLIRLSALVWCFSKTTVAFTHTSVWYLNLHIFTLTSLGESSPQNWKARTEEGHHFMTIICGSGLIQQPLHIFRSYSIWATLRYHVVGTLLQLARHLIGNMDAHSSESLPNGPSCRRDCSHPAWVVFQATTRFQQSWGDISG